MPTPAPVPSPSPAPNPAHAAIHGIWHGIEALAIHQPWVVALALIAVTCGLVRSARVAIHSGPRDSVRLFSRRQKAVLLDRAGHRCEHHGWVGGRCTAVDHLEADHVHPYSRGGWTDISNGQVLCRRHNREKSATIPWDRTLRRLSERRFAYYPSDVGREVVRRGPRQALDSTAATPGPVPDTA